MEIKRGTFCVVVQQQLVVSNCPLPQGACAWKHRVSGQCRYVDREFTIKELAEWIGDKPLSDKEVEAIKTNLLTTIRASTKT